LILLGIMRRIVIRIEMHKLEKIDINLHVKSLEETFIWYKRVLGWESGCDQTNDRGECLFGDVHYSYEPFIGFNLVKSESNNLPYGFHPLIKTTNIEELYNEVKTKNIEIVSELSNQPWGKTFKISDYNGFILEFWSEY